MHWNVVNMTETLTENIYITIPLNVRASAFAQQVVCEYRCMFDALSVPDSSMWPRARAAKGQALGKRFVTLLGYFRLRRLKLSS